jgi:hypothetical protein
MSLPGKPRTARMSPGIVATAERRFWTKVDKSGDCWLWTAATNGAGYGILTMSRDGSKVLAHRWSYEHHNGPIPEGLVIDHLCRVPLCVRPDHLEAVTQAENNRRGMSLSSQQARQTHCKRGHEFEPERNTAGRRWCKRCHSLNMSIAYYRNRGRPVPDHILAEWNAA